MHNYVESIHISFAVRRWALCIARRRLWWCMSSTRTGST